MKRKIKGLLFRLPGIILLLIAVIGSFYAKIANVFPIPITWATPITILVIFLLYLRGEYLAMKEEYY